MGEDQFGRARNRPLRRLLEECSRLRMIRDGSSRVCRAPLARGDIARAEMRGNRRCHAQCCPVGAREPLPQPRSHRSLFLVGWPDAYDGEDTASTLLRMTATRPAHPLCRARPPAEAPASGSTWAGRFARSPRGLLCPGHQGHARRQDRSVGTVDQGQRAGQHSGLGRGRSDCDWRRSPPGAPGALASAPRRRTRRRTPWTSSAVRTVQGVPER